MNLATSPFHLDTQRVLVTGAASGIGLATCILLSQLGSRIVGVDSNEEGLDSALKKLSGSGHSSACFDLRQIDLIPDLLKDIATSGGPLIGVVHAAGLPCIQPVRLLNSAHYRDALLINTEAALALARGFSSKKVCEPSGGSIVFISSVMALSGSPGAAGYAMTKAALIGLMKSLAIELAPRRIRVNCVSPGFVRTPMFERLSVIAGAEQLESIEAAHPLGLGEPEDVACALAFLLARTGRWITGSNLIVDGGYTAQ